MLVQGEDDAVGLAPTRAHMKTAACSDTRHQLASRTNSLSKVHEQRICARENGYCMGYVGELKTSTDLTQWHLHNVYVLNRHKRFLPEC